MHREFAFIHGWSWDDLKIVLAVARSGSISLAAQELGVAHTTVSRWLATFEAATGANLFEKTAKGYVVNHDRLQAFEALNHARAAVEKAKMRFRRFLLPQVNRCD